jgi:hypothetical protein
MNLFFLLGHLCLCQLRLLCLHIPPPPHIVLLPPARRRRLNPAQPPAAAPSPHIATPPPCTHATPPPTAHHAPQPNQAASDVPLLELEIPAHHDEQPLPPTLVPTIATSSPPTPMPPNTSTPPAPCHHMITYARDGIRQPNPRYATTTLTSPPSAPSSFHAALLGLDWRQAMEDEYKAL